MASILLAACSAPSGDLSLADGGAADIALHPTLSDLYGSTANMTLVIDGEEHQALVDTGSLYLFVGSEKGDVELSCSKPTTTHYGEGSAEFCPKTSSVKAKSIDGSEIQLDPELTFGEARFTDWSPPYAIIGVSTIDTDDVKGETRGGVEPVLEQIDPDYLSFQFPNGSQNDAIFGFAPLPTDMLRGVSAIPLVRSGSLKSGYEAELARVDFIANDAIRATIETRDDGVYLERNGESSRIADSNLALFDTGTSAPFVPLNGVLAANNETLQEAFITFSGREPFDTVQFTFEVGDGNHVVLVNDQIRRYASGNPFVTVPEASDFPKDLKELLSVVGFGTLSGYDFQITFDDGKATTIHFAAS